MEKKFKVISFDADDTLWVNETYYRDTEDHFCRLMSDYCSKETASKELFKKEVGNLNLYGYGAKGFILSMVEAALSVSENSVSQDIIAQILNLGKDQINQPLVLLEGVEETLKRLSRDNVKLIVATKGDLLDQERKLSNSGIEKYFHHIEIMSDKKESNYRKLLEHLEIKAEDFLMIGNSLKSDIIPVLELGGYGIHVPYHTTWQHEVSEAVDNSSNLKELQNISQVVQALTEWDQA